MGIETELARQLVDAENVQQLLGVVTVALSAVLVFMGGLYVRSQKELRGIMEQHAGKLVELANASVRATVEAEAFLDRLQVQVQEQQRLVEGMRHEMRDAHALHQAALERLRDSLGHQQYPNR